MTIKKVDISIDRDIWDGFELQPCANLKPDVSLYDFQQYAIYRSLSLETSINSLQTGLGKTVCSIAGFYYYKTKHPKTKLIVLTTTSAVIQFAKEFEKFFDFSEVVVPVHSSMPLQKRKYAEVRQAAFERWGQEGNGSVDVLLMNYTIFRMEFDKILKGAQQAQKKGWRIFAIYDEVTAVKSSKAEVSRRVKTFSRYVDKIVALTATFTKGKLEEIYSICSNIGIQLTKTKAAFERRYCQTWQHPDRSKWFIKKITGYKNIEEIIAKVSEFAVVLKKSDVSDKLPSIVVQRRTLIHSDEQIRVVNDIYQGELDLTAYASGEVENPFHKEEEAEANPFVMGLEEEQEERDPNKRYIEGVVDVGLVKMALLDPRLVHRQRMKEYEDLSPKTEALFSMLRDEMVDEKVIVYTHSRMYLDMLFHSIKKAKGLPSFYKWPVRISGSVSPKDREENKQKFMTSDKHNIIILNTAGLEAINLQAANQMVVTTLPHTAGDLLQLAGRFSRLGSQHTALFLRFLLMENSQDMDEYDIIMRQLHLLTLVMGEAEKGLLDMDFLMQQDSAFNAEEYQTQKLAYFLVKTRGKRKKGYEKLMEGVR